MKNYNGVMVIGCDHGYGNMKTANTLFPSSVTAYKEKPVFGGDVLQYAGTYYKIGEGHNEFISNKTADEDYYILTLAAVAKELAVYGICTAKVYLAAGLPLAWVKSQRKSFSEYLLCREHIEFTLNDTLYRIQFTGCRVFPQGYSALYEHISECKGSNLLADIGNGTMNILYINNGKVSEAKAWTEKLGMNQCVIAVRNAVLAQLEVKIDDQTIEDVLRGSEGNLDLRYLKCIWAEARRYVMNIFEALRRYEYTPATTHLWIVGGGGCLIRNFGEYDADRVTIIEDICAAAKGYEHLAVLAFRMAGER